MHRYTMSKQSRAPHLFPFTSLRNASRPNGSASALASVPWLGGLHSFTSQLGLTLVHFSAQPKPFRSHLPVSPCLIDWGTLMIPTYLTKCAYVDRKSGRTEAPALALVLNWSRPQGLTLVHFSAQRKHILWDWSGA